MPNGDEQKTEAASAPAGAATQTLIPLQSSLVGDNIQASETLALLLPTLGLIPCVCYGAAVYYDPALTFTECSSTGEPPAYLPRASLGGATVYEPFSSATNLCYWLAGVAIYLYQAPNLAFLFPQMYWLGVLFVILGVGSASFHALGSVLGTWAHAADIFGIYLLFTGLSGAAVLGLYYCIKGRGQQASDRCVLPLVTVATFVLFAFCIFFWRQIDQGLFLGIAGAVIIVCNATAAAIYAFRARDGEPSSSRWCSTVLAFLVTAVPRLVVLGCAAVLNLVGREVINPYELQRTCAEVGTDLDEILRRIELLKQWDYLHGFWHVLTAVVLTAMGLTSQEGLTGKTVPRGVTHSRTCCGDTACLTRVAITTNEFVEELISRIVTSVVAALCVILFAAGATSAVWIPFSLVVGVLLLPTWAIWGAVQVLRTAKRNIEASIQASTDVHGA